MLTRIFNAGDTRPMRTLSLPCRIRKGCMKSHLKFLQPTDASVLVRARLREARRAISFHESSHVQHAPKETPCFSKLGVYRFASKLKLCVMQRTGSRQILSSSQGYIIT